MSGNAEFPASFEQTRVWVAHKLSLGRVPPSYVRAVRLSGALDHDSLRAALGRIAARHAVLRTCLEDRNGQLLQIVKELIDVPLQFVDLDGTRQNREDRTRHAALEFADQAFDLSAAPLWRLLLVRLGAGEHVLITCFHAAICDGAATVRCFLQELLTEYHPQTPAMASTCCAASYADYALHQRTTSQEVLSAQRTYWTDYLTDRLQSTALPIFRPRPPLRTFRGASFQREIPQHLLSRLEELCARTGSSASAGFLAILSSLLYRYTAQDRVVVGHIVSARGSKWAEALGNFANPAALSCEFAETATFATILAQVAGRLAEAELNRNVPFQEVVQLLGVPPDASLTPLFQILFESELEIPEPPSLSADPELSIDDFELPNIVVDYDLLIAVRRSGEGATIGWTYDTEVYEPRIVEQFASHFHQLLSGVLETPEARISQIEYLSEADRAEIRRCWNTVRTPYPKAPVQTFIDEQAKRTPAATAVEFEDVRLSYADLAAQSSRLANYLIAVGVEPGHMIGLCLGRSIEMIVAIVGIWKAGGAVLPLDPTYPEERVRFMLSDAGARTVISSSDIVAQSSGLTELFSDRTLIVYDRHQAKISRASEQSPAGASPNATAYCIYTSGSTGTPKGVAVDHAALCNLLAWHRRQWLAEPGVRTLLFSPVSFDVAFHEIVVGLCTGATLVQIDEATRSNAIALLEFAAQKAIAKWYMPFVSLQQIAEAARTRDAPTTLRELIVGGEQLRITPEIREFARRTGSVIHNHYGSTECIDVASYTLSGSVDAWPTLVPIGRANVDNMNAYILDRWRQLVPIGVTGELYADGDCLAQHYLNRTELNRERFLENPFSVQGDRLYKLGDLARYLPDGNIQCLGRADQQVKIRGFRVETGEIESVLASHPAVAECVVSIKSGPRGGHRITAYVVARHDRHVPFPSSDVRTFLSESLPDYMLPTAIVPLEYLAAYAEREGGRRTPARTGGLQREVDCFRRNRQRPAS